MDTILISTSKFDTVIPNYFKYLGEEFSKNNFSIVYIFDGQIKKLPNFLIVPDKEIKKYLYQNKLSTQILVAKHPIISIKIFINDKALFKPINIPSIILLFLNILKMDHVNKCLINRVKET